jgi:hypothetical protein
MACSNLHLFSSLSRVLQSAFCSDRRSRGAAIPETYLIYFLFIYIGLMGLLTAYAHVFRPVQTSASIGGDSQAIRIRSRHG